METMRPASTTICWSRVRPPRPSSTVPARITTRDWPKATAANSAAISNRTLLARGQRVLAFHLIFGGVRTGRLALIGSFALQALQFAGAAGVRPRPFAALRSAVLVHGPRALEAQKRLVSVLHRDHHVAAILCLAARHIACQGSRIAFALQSGHFDG